MFSPPPPQCDPTLERLRQWTALATLLLLGATWRLWLPTSTEGFPLIPLFESLSSVPLFVDWVLMVALVLGLLAMLLPLRHGAEPSSAAARAHAAASLTVLVSGVALVSLSQHRIQPWFYQLMIFCGLFLLPRSRHQLLLFQVVVVSVYFYSAVGKFDFEFLHTVGQQFLSVLLEAVHVDVSRWAWSSRLAAAMLFPATELALAIALAAGCGWSPRVGRWSGVAACLFHLGLMAIFGLGLGHSTGVVLWNLQFAVQALLLFSLPWRREIATAGQGRLTGHPGLDRSVRASFGSLLVAAVVVLPMFERWGLWDHWPSWALYAPHSSRVEVLIAPPAVARLPEELRALVENNGDGELTDLWLRVPLAQWSLESLGTPIYPQSRFELGVARDLASRIDSQFAIRATILGPAGRIDGRRSRLELRGTRQIDRAAEKFFLNTVPRSLARPDE